METTLSKVLFTLFFGVLTSLVAWWISTKIETKVFTIQIKSTTNSASISIDSNSEKAKPNQDGIIFLFVGGSIKGVPENPIMELQPKDVPNWFKQSDPVLDTEKGKYIGRVQLGSIGWPIHGGEEFLVRVSLGKDQAQARISIFP